jgi:nucleoside phosphorylase
MPEATDIAILFALEEEYLDFAPQLPRSKRVEVDPKTGRAFVLFEQEVEGGEPYSCVTGFIGSMGAQDAALFCKDALEKFGPQTVVLVGIAGSLDKEVLVGDILVADEITDYMQDGKIEDERFKPGGRSYRAHVRLKNVVQYLQLTHDAALQRFLDESYEDSRKAADGVNLKTFPVMARLDAPPKIWVGHLASGPTVVASTVFANWLCDQDRKYRAVEMEAAGVMNAVYQGAGDERVLVIRAISDLSDARKEEFDRTKSGLFRRLAMRNALRLLRALMESGEFERAPKSSIDLAGEVRRKLENTARRVGQLLEKQKEQAGTSIALRATLKAIELIIDTHKALFLDLAGKLSDEQAISNAEYTRACGKAIQHYLGAQDISPLLARCLGALEVFQRQPWVVEREDLRAVLEKLVETLKFFQEDVGQIGWTSYGHLECLLDPALNYPERRQPGPPIHEMAQEVLRTNSWQRVHEIFELMGRVMV